MTFYSGYKDLNSGGGLNNKMKKEFNIKKIGVETHIRGTKKCINCRIRWALPYRDLCFTCLNKGRRERKYLFIKDEINRMIKVK